MTNDCFPVGYECGYTYDHMDRSLDHHRVKADIVLGVIK